MYMFFVAFLDQDSETQLPASDTMPVAATQTPRQPSQAGPFHNYQKRGPDGKPKEKPKEKRTDSGAVCLAKNGKTQTRKKDTPKTVRGTDKKGHVRGTGKKDMPKTGQGPVQPKMPKRMVDFQTTLLQKPGQVITAADIKASFYKKLRNNAMTAMVRTLSERQQLNYKNCQSDRQRHEWVAQYMADPEKVKLHGAEVATLTGDEHKEVIQAELNLAKKKLMFAETKLQALGNKEIVDQRRTEDTPARAMKSEGAMKRKRMR